MTEHQVGRLVFGGVLNLAYYLYIVYLGLTGAETVAVVFGILMGMLTTAILLETYLKWSEDARYPNDEESDSWNPR